MTSGARRAALWRLRRWGGALGSAVTDRLFEPGCLRCAGGGRPRAAGVCLDCWLALRAPTGTGGGPGRPLARSSSWSWLEAALAYEGVARDLILLYKFGPAGGRPLLAGPLARLLAARLLASGIGTGVAVLTSVESGRGRRRKRGFDAARRLALHAARCAGLPRPHRLLRRLDRGGPLSPSPIFGLRSRARRRIGGRTVLLLDDVLTTGGTADTCVRLLLAAGAAEVRVAVLARTPPPGLTCAAAGGRRTATLEIP